MKTSGEAFAAIVSECCNAASANEDRVRMAKVLAVPVIAAGVLHRADSMIMRESIKITNADGSVVHEGAAFKDEQAKLEFEQKLQSEIDEGVERIKRFLSNEL